jgi:tetrahydromethanopterin S-methyltransferase subunit H
MNNSRARGDCDRYVTLEARLGGPVGLGWMNLPCSTEGLQRVNAYMQSYVQCCDCAKLLTVSTW